MDRTTNQALALFGYTSAPSRDGHRLADLYAVCAVGEILDLGAHAFADASLQADFERRAIVIDPYDVDGEDIRDRPPVSAAA